MAKRIKRSAPSTEFEQQMMIAVLSLREGEVVSFGDIAAKAGRPDAPRAAGRLLATSQVDLPWWRVVYSNGKIPECNSPRQQNRLIDEGVTIDGDRVLSSPLGRFRKARSTKKRH